MVLRNQVNFLVVQCRCGQIVRSHQVRVHMRTHHSDPAHGSHFRVYFCSKCLSVCLPTQTVASFVDRHEACRDGQKLREDIIRGFFRRPRSQWAGENERLATVQLRADLEISSDPSHDVDLDASSGRPSPSQPAESNSSVDAIISTRPLPEAAIPSPPLATSTPPPPTSTAPLATSTPPPPTSTAPIALSAPPASRPRQSRLRLWRRFSRQTARPVSETTAINDLKSQLALVRQRFEGEQRARVAAEARCSQLHATTQRCLALEAALSAEQVAHQRTKELHRGEMEEEREARSRAEAQLSSTEIQLADVELQVERRDAQVEELEAQIGMMRHEQEYMVHIPYRGHRLRASPLIDTDLDMTSQCYERPERDIKCMHLSIAVHGNQMTRFRIHANRRLAEIDEPVTQPPPYNG